MLADVGVGNQAKLDYILQLRWKPPNHTVMKEAVKMLAKADWEVTAEIREWMIKVDGQEQAKLFSIEDWDTSAVTDMSDTIERGWDVLPPGDGCTLGKQAAKRASSCTKLGKSDVTTRIQNYVQRGIFIQPGSACLAAIPRLA